MEEEQNREFKYPPAPLGKEMTPAAERALQKQREVAQRITVEIGVYITPIMAAGMMENNAGNRAISKKRVQSYKEKHRSGRWLYNNATIGFDYNNRLIDGQKRLLSCIETGIPFYATIIRGLDPISQDVTDRGENRTLPGQLSARNEPNFKNLGSLISMYWRLIRHRMHWSGSGAGASIPMDVDEGIELFETDQEGFRAAVKPASRSNRALRIPPAIAGCLYYAMNTVEPDDNEFYWESLNTGLNLEDNDPVLILRNKLIVDMGKTPEQKMDKVRMSAYIIKGWNHYYNGQRVNDIRWYPGGSKQEPFPLIAGFSGYLFERRPRGRVAKHDKRREPKEDK